MGKTALAVHWAHRVSRRFPDGQLYVDLRGFDPSGPPMTPAEAVRGLLDSLGVAASGIPADPAAQVGLYRSLLADQRILVILDNACDAEQVRPLLPGSRGSMTVVTSRNNLTSVVAVDGAHSLILDLLPIEEARELLAQRLGQARVAAEPQVVDEVVNRCARLPLALSIAAARADARPTFTLATLARELRVAQGSLDPFADDDASADARAAFSCSYQHLHADAATMFRRLGTHPGPDIAVAAAASLAGTPTTRARMALADLARAHLVTEPAPGRYTFHDLLRAFAREQTQRHDSADDRYAAIQRALEHYLHTAHAAAQLLYPQRDPIAVEPPRPQVTPEHLPDREAARAWFETEHRVLLAAVQQAADTQRDTLAWQLAWALADYLDWRGHWHDLADVQTLALDAATRSADRLGQAHAHRNLARAHVRLDRLDDAHHHLGQAIQLAEAIGDRVIEASSHLNLSLVLERHGQHRRALTHSHRAHDISRAAGHQVGQAKSLNAIGWYQTLLGEHENALASLTRALSLQLDIGCRNDLPSTLDSLGYAQHSLGRHREAAISYQHAVDLYRESGDRYHEADTLIHLGDAHHAAGDTSAARAARQRALEILGALPHPRAANPGVSTALPRG